MSTTRPGQNKNGQTKQPSANPDGGARPQLAPSANPAGVNPMTHPNHPDMQAQATNAAGGTKVSALEPVHTPNPGGGPLGNIQPVPTSDVRQVRQNINFHDMSPIEQGQVAQQQGLNPYLPLQMLQQQASGAATQGPSSGAVPNTLMGPFTPPGVEAFPDDMAHLTTLMQQGYAPGASPQEHGLAQNAHAIARAREASSQAQADQTSQSQQHMQALGGAAQQLGASGAPMPSPQELAAHMASYAIPPGAPGPAAGMSPMPGTMPMPQQAPAPIPTPQGPAPQGAPTAPPGPPMQAGAPGGIPPALIQQLLARAQQKRHVG